MRGAEDLHFGKSSLPRGDLHSELGKKAPHAHIVRAGKKIDALCSIRELILEGLLVNFYV